MFNLWFTFYHDDVVFFRQSRTAQPLRIGIAV